MEKEILKALSELGVYKVKVDRDANIHGAPAFQVTAYINGPLAEAVFRFAKANGMSAHHMATVMWSYLRPQAALHS